MKKLFREWKSKHEKGYTLLEILVVIVILAVLVTFTIPTYQKLVRRSQAADGLNTLDILAGAQEKYFIEYGAYSKELGKLKAPIKSLPNPSPDVIETENFIYRQEINRYCISAISNKGNYTLVRNYRSGIIFCTGNDCDNFSDYVGVEDFNAVCPQDENWGMSKNNPGDEQGQGGGEGKGNDGGIQGDSIKNKISGDTNQKNKIDAQGNRKGGGGTVCIDCKNCESGKCESASKCNDIPQLPDLYVDDTQQCKKYDQKCLSENSDAKNWNWQYTGDIIWAQPDYNCITGSNPINCQNTDKKGSFNGYQHCNNCKWGECVPSRCNPATKPESTKAVCFTSGDECGTKTTEYYCNQEDGSWTASDTACNGAFGLKPKDALDPIWDPEHNLKLDQEWQCSIDGWVAVPINNPNV